MQRPAQTANSAPSHCSGSSDADVTDQEISAQLAVLNEHYIGSGFSFDASL